MPCVAKMQRMARRIPSKRSSRAASEDSCDCLEDGNSKQKGILLTKITIVEQVETLTRYIDRKPRHSVSDDCSLYALNPKRL